MPGNLAFTPSIGDIDNNGTQDIIISLSSGSLYALNTDGSFLNGFPLVETNRSFSYQSPIIFDFDGDVPIILQIKHELPDLVAYKVRVSHEELQIARDWYACEIITETTEAA